MFFYNYSTEFTEGGIFEKKKQFKLHLLLKCHLEVAENVPCISKLTQPH